MIDATVHLRIAESAVLLILLCAFPTGFGLLTAFVGFKRASGYYGLGILALIFVANLYPFYFQGYRGLLERCVWEAHSLSLECPHSLPPEKEVGIPVAPVIGFFSYILSLGGGALAFLALLFAVLGLAFGKVAAHKHLDTAIRLVAIVLAVWAVSNVYQFTVIADWTD